MGVPDAKNLMSEAPSNLGNDTPGRGSEYVVVARRYRPQLFEELIGQQHVAKALSGAIATERVGHAYLFTGARGVGKTSAARIFAKALNCIEGPTPVPCNTCDICESISSGDDVDVLEIDGASNRGIDEIRALRQNANVRPSRSRFKIYIIDEVHMLTREAFNALLKTLEEPPEHVKFIFCTTDPQKIPITILSRCQRYDFAGIVATSIAERLRQIAEAERVTIASEAIEVLARRAAGSMRDGQSLLEQLLAFASEQITLDDVHAMLGTAGDEVLGRLVEAMVQRDAAAALGTLDAALAEGVDVAQLVEQLFGYLRDCMAAAAGCPSETLLYASPSSHEHIVSAGKQLGLSTILAAMQILDQTLFRLRQSTQGRVLAELALARICALEDLEALPELIAALRSGSAVPEPAARSSPARPSPPPAGSSRAASLIASSASPAETTPQEVRSSSPGEGAIANTSENVGSIWDQALKRVGGLSAGQAAHFDHVAISAPNHLVVWFRPRYTLAKSYCERPEQAARFQKVLAEITGQAVRLDFALMDEESIPDKAERPADVVSPHQRLLQITEHPLVRQAGELFGAQPIRVDEPPKKA